MLLGNKEAKLPQNILSVKCVSKSIANADNWEYDIPKRDQLNKIPFDKEILDKNTI